MGLFKSILDKVRDKKDELQKAAAKKAARIAVDQSAKAAKGALNSAGKAIEKALFGNAEEEHPHEEEKPDPFAQLKASEAEKKRRDREEKLHAAERAEEQAKAEKEIDAELAALKKKLDR
jgi:hypothetical protein